MEQKLVVHRKDGTVHKGVTQDFDPDQAAFHVLPAEGGGVPVRMKLDELKALFWVKDYLGNRHFVARRAFGAQAAAARKAVVTFEDGEEIWGTLEGGEYPAGFFLVPADPGDNNLRVFVVRSALRELRAV